MSSDKRKRDIVKAAIALFAVKSYEQTKVEHIASEADIPLPTLYRLCLSKENILLMIYEKFWENIVASIDSIVNGIWGNDAIIKLKQIITIAQITITQDMNLIKVISTTSLPPPEKIDNEDLKKRRLSIRAKNREMLKLIDQVILEGQKNEQITDKLPPQVIRQIMIGAYQTLAYGLIIQFTQREKVGYSVADANEGVNYLLDSFISK